MAAFPVLPGIEALTILAENDRTNRRAINQCASAGTGWRQGDRD